MAVVTDPSRPGGPSDSARRLWLAAASCRTVQIIFLGIAWQHSRMPPEIRHGESQEAEQRHPTAPIGSPEQARELMRKMGRDRDKLNEAAAKLFRR